jgi:hypothetical protein
MCGRMDKPEGGSERLMTIHLNGQSWTRREVVIWLSAMIVAVVLGVLFITKVLGSWVLLVAPTLSLGVVFMRYRADSPGS